MYIWVALKESAKLAMILWQIAGICSKPGFLQEPRKNYLQELQGKPDAEIVSSWSHDMQGHAKKCVERHCELANKTTQQLFKVATACMDDHQLKEEENESVGELFTVCSQQMSESGSYCETWHFYGLWINLPVQLQNGQNLATNAWRVWSRTFIGLCGWHKIGWTETKH